MISVVIIMLLLRTTNNFLFLLNHCYHHKIFVIQKTIITSNISSLGLHTMFCLNCLVVQQRVARSILMNASQLINLCRQVDLNSLGLQIILRTLTGICETWMKTLNFDNVTKNKVVVSRDWLREMWWFLDNVPSYLANLQFRTDETEISCQKLAIIAFWGWISLRYVSDETRFVQGRQCIWGMLVKQWWTTEH
jgi:hypothetical protein